MGLQVSRGVHPEISPPGTLQGTPEPSGRGVSFLGSAERVSRRRRALTARPCAYAAIDSAQVAVAHIVGFIKGKSAIHIALTFLGRRRNYTGQHFWARGYS